MSTPAPEDAGTVAELVRSLKAGELEKKDFFAKLTSVYRTRQRQNHQQQEQKQQDTQQEIRTTPSTADRRRAVLEFFQKHSSPVPPAVPDDRSATDDIDLEQLMKEMEQTKIQYIDAKGIALQQKRHEEGPATSSQSSAVKDPQSRGDRSSLVQELSYDSPEQLQQQQQAFPSYSFHEEPDSFSYFDDQQDQSFQATDSDVPQHMRPTRPVVVLSKQPHARSVSAGAAASSSAPYQHNRRTSIRRQQLEERLKQERAEIFTFKPKVNPLPDFYKVASDKNAGGSGGQANQRRRDSDMYEKSIEWQNRRREEDESKAARRKLEEEQECTFTPKINKPPSESRLSSELRQQLLRERSRTRALLTERKIKAEQERELAENCTFTPQINENSTTPSRRKSGAGKSEANRVQGPGQRWKQQWMLERERECTFAPQINDVPDQFEAAQLYLEQDPFERLSQPRVRNSADFDAEVDFSNSVDDMGTGDESGHRRRHSDGGRERQARFREFLARQEYQLIKKETRVSQLREAEMKEMGTPRINRKSKAMIESAPNTPSSKLVGSTFMQRVQLSAHKKKEIRHGRGLQDPDHELTFTPEITPWSKQLPPRTPSELSTGDQLRKEARLKAAAMQAQQEELAEATFKPHLQSSSVVRRHVRSDMEDLRSHPEHFLAKLESKREEATRMQREALEQRVREEVEACTFKPEVRESPAYVKRMIQGFRIARESQAASAPPDTPTRPEWR